MYTLEEQCAIQAGLRLLHNHYEGAPLTSQTIAKILTNEGKVAPLSTEQIQELEMKIQTNRG